MNEHRAIASVVVITAGLLHGGGTTARTLAQDLAWERWTSCASQHSEISLNRIDADGRVWVTFGTADNTRAFNAWHATLCRRGAGDDPSPGCAGAPQIPTDRSRTP